MTQLSKTCQKRDLFPVIQSVEWRQSERLPDLYYRSRGAEKFGDGLRLPTEASVSFNTYFGSFYEDYWLRHTSVQRVAIRLFYSGSLKVCVFRVTAAGRSKLVLERHLPPAIESEVMLELATPKDRSGRVYFQVFGTDDGGCLLKAEYLALESPRARDISLSVGICTYNREIQLMDNLKRLFSCESALKPIRRLIIVNQGEPFSEVAEQTIAAAPVEIILLEQENQGGTGGFSRTIEEAAQKEDYTHHILMDDDIDLDPEVFTRTAQFLAFADEKVVLGATLFNSVHPNICYEAGVIVRKNGEFRLLAQNTDMTISNSLSVFNHEKNTPDYSGWWYSAIPINAIRTVPRPLSLFIKWDDIEYGLSLGQHGFTTVCLPRIAVSHPPFNSVPEEWKTYYFARNRLITSAVHPNKMRLPSRYRMFFGMAIALGKMDYHSAALLILATEDFLAGPEELLSTPLQDIQDRVAQTKVFSRMEKLSINEMPEQRPATLVFKLRYLRRWLRDVISAVACAANLFRHWRKTPSNSPIHVLEMEYWNVLMVGGDPYFLTNSEGNFLWKYSPDSKISRKLFYECWLVAELYGKSKRAVAREWNIAGCSREV